MPTRERDRTAQNEAQRRWKQKAQLDPVYRAKKAAYERAYRARKKAEPSARPPADRTERDRRYRTENAEKIREYEARPEVLARRAAAKRRRRAASARIELPAGMLVNAAPSPWASVLARLTAAAGRSEDAEDIAAEAAALVVEGMDEATAIREARRLVRENAKFLRFATVEYVETR